MISLSEIKKIFVPKAFPTADQFWNTFTSYWHKSERLPQSQVLGLNDEIKRIDDTKATKDEVKNIMAGLRPMGNVETEAELRAIADPNDNDSYYVNETKDANGDPYIWRFDKNIGEHGDWVNTKQVVYQDVARKGGYNGTLQDIDNVKLSKEPVNNTLLDTAWTNGLYISEGGITNVLAASAYSGYLPINPILKYYLVILDKKAEMYPVWGCAFDKDKNVKLSGVVNDIAANIKEFTFNASTNFVQINVALLNIPSAYFVDEFEYQKLLTGKISAQNLVDYSFVLENVAGVTKSENILIDGFEVTQGGYFGESGSIIPNDNFGYTEPKPIKGGKKYYTNVHTAYHVSLLFKNSFGNVVGFFGDIPGGNSGKIVDFTPPQSAVTIQFVVPLQKGANSISSGFFIKEETTKDYFVSESSGIESYEVAKIESAQPLVAINYAENAEIIPDGYFNDSGNWVPNNNFNTLKFAVNPNTEYEFSKVHQSNNGQWIDKTGLQIKPFGNTGTGSTVKFNFVSPSSAIACTFTVSKTDMANIYCKEAAKVAIETARGVIVPMITTPEQRPLVKTFNLSMRNDFTFVGATNTIFDAFYAANPRIRIAIGTYFSYDAKNVYDKNRKIENLIDTQVKVAKHWGLPYLNLADKMGWVKRDGANIIQRYFNDCLHPATDLTGQSSIMIKNYYVELLRPLFGNEWEGKKGVTIGTSITVGHGGAGYVTDYNKRNGYVTVNGIKASYLVNGSGVAGRGYTTADLTQYLNLAEGATIEWNGQTDTTTSSKDIIQILSSFGLQMWYVSKHIDAAILELGGIVENVGVSGQVARRKKVDGTIITTNSSFMDENNSKNYLYVADKIANKLFDFVVYEHGVNDMSLDETDFIEKY